MPRLSLLLVPLVWLCLLPLLSQAAEPVGGEQIAWRELVVQTPPGWFRVPEQEGDGGDMAVFAAKSDGTLAVVTLSLLDKTVPNTAASTALLEEFRAAYVDDSGYSNVAVHTASAATVLGQEQPPYLTYQRGDKRYFVFFPPSTGENYNLNVVVPAAAGQELPAFVAYFLGRVQTADAWQQAEAEAAKKRLQSLQDVRLQLPPVQTAPFLEIDSLTQNQWDGAVTAAQQAVGMLYGDLSPEEQKQFAAAWAPMRGFPTQKCVDYLNGLNPLLGEFLALRTAINRTSGQLEQAMIEAGWAAELDAETLTRQYLALAARYRDFLYSLQNRMDAVAQDIAALGDPPDAKALMQQAQQGYQRSKDYVRSLGRVETGPEGVWVGYVEYPKGVVGLNSVKWQPLMFVVYNVSSKGEPALYRSFYLDDPDEEGPRMFLAALPLQKFNLLDSFHQDTLNAEISDEDGDSWSVYAQRQVDSTLPIFSGAELKLYEEEGQKELAALAEEKKELAALLEATKDNKKALEYAGKIAGVAVGEKLTQSAIKDARFHYRMRSYFLQAARQWLTERTWGPDIQSDMRAMQVLLEKHSGGMPPSGESLQAGKSEDEQLVKTPEIPTSGTPASLHLVDDKTTDERRQLDQEAVRFHERNIQSIRRNLERDREELAEATDPTRRHALQQRILHGESDIQSERDRIATLKTGTLVHSRSPFDDYAKSRFIQNIARDQRKMETITKATENAYKLAGRLPEDKARQVRAAADEHLGPELMASLDAQQAREVINTLSSVAQSHWEAERYKAGADAAWADAGLQTAKSVKRGADQAMEYASMAGGQSVYMAYQGATGYIEGGPKEAVLRVAGSYNKVTGTVASAYRGYEEDGVKEAFLRVAGSYNEATGWAEDFYRGYQASDGDLLEAMGGATWKMTKAMAINKGTQFATNRISQRFATAPKSAGTTVRKTTAGKTAKTGKRTTQALGRAKRKPSDPNADFNRPLTDTEIKDFRTQVADGRTRVTSYKKTYAKLQKARKAKAPPKEIKKLLGELDDRAAKIHGSPQAKIMMKNLQSSPQNKDLVKRYCNAMDRVHTRTEKRFRDTMAKKGWKTQNMVPIRNKRSGKSVNMDYDIALKEEPWFDKNGKPNPWLTKNGKNAPVVAWQAEAQQEWNAAFRAETGQDPTRSFETVTTSKHHEAYADLRVLEKNGVLAADKGWAQQTGDVSQAKAWDLRANTKMGRAEKYVEIARGTAKDAKRKLLPLLDNNKPKQGTPSFKVWEKHKNYWSKVSKVMEDMGAMKLSPMEADRKIRLITGGKSVVEVTEDMSQLMSASITLGK